MAIILTKAEADLLINMMKRTIRQLNLEFPNAKGKLEFDVLGEQRTDEFVVNIERKGINSHGCTYQGRVKSNNIILLRLDVNPSSIHINPSNGEKIIGSHLHLYTDEFELREAIPFDVDNKDLYQVCYEFFSQFHITEPPTLRYQYSITDRGCE